MTSEHKIMNAKENDICCFAFAFVFVFVLPFKVNLVRNSNPQKGMMQLEIHLLKNMYIVQ